MMRKLTDKERAVYEWQLDVPGFGEEGQEKLKNASVLVSRCGGLGSVVAYELASAGIGKLILAHGGNVKDSDLNRQLLMTDDWLGKPRIESVERRLKELNPRLEILAVTTRRWAHTRLPAAAPGLRWERIRTALRQPGCRPARTHRLIRPRSTTKWARCPA